MYDTIIIGAGISGLTSALYLLRAGKKVLILEKKAYGGQIIEANEIRNYPGIDKISGFDLATRLYQQVSEYSVDIKYEEVIEIEKDKKVKTNKNQYQAKSVIIATGSSPRKLNIEKEDELIGKGISYCATCDGNFYQDKDVLVVGGGNTAIEDTLYLSNICKKVFLVHRRDEFRAEKHLIDRIKMKQNIEIIYESKIIKLNGEDLLESIELINKNKKKRKIKVDGLFIAIGRNPNTDQFKIIKLNQEGYIDSHDTKTNIEGIFVAGDVREKILRQLVTAASDGAIASSYVLEYLNH